MSENLPSADELRALADKIEDSEDEDEEISDIIDSLLFSGAHTVHCDTEGKDCDYIVSLTDSIRSRNLKDIVEDDRVGLAYLVWGSETSRNDESVELFIDDLRGDDD